MNPNKEMLYQAQDVVTAEEMAKLQVGLLDQASRTERRFAPLATTMTIDVPPIGEQVRVIDIHNRMDTYLDIMGFSITASVENDENLVPNTMSWMLETSF